MGLAKSEPFIALILCGVAGGVLASVSDSHKVFLFFAPFLALFGFFGVAAMLSSMRSLRRRCVKCAEGRLELISSILATCEGEDGRPYPSSRTYYLCDRCGYRGKATTEIEGISDVPDEEWEVYCSK